MCEGGILCPYLLNFRKSHFLKNMVKNQTKTFYVVDEKNHEIYQVKLPVDDSFNPPDSICIFGKIYERYTPNTYKAKLIDCYEVSNDEILVDERPSRFAKLKNV